MAAAVGATPRAAPYARRRPETALLHRTLSGHLDTFLARQAEAGGRLPGFVRRTLTGYLRCGILAHGFARVRCRACRHDQLVAFSCKARGVCPACAARRMAEGAAHLVDRVLPHVPVRQWVFSLPHAWRLRIAYDQHLCSRLLRLCIEATFRRYRATAKRAGHVALMATPRPGSVTCIQRFSGALGLNVHFHALVLDGVYVESGAGPPRFVALPPPAHAEMRAVAAEAAAAAARLAGADRADRDADPQERTLLAACSQASVQGRVATGPRAGARSRRLLGLTPAKQHRRRLPRAVAEVDGFNLHAGVRVPAHDRRRLERLCRYILRPALCPERLSERPDGSLRYALRRPWADGTTAVCMAPAELIERLVPLVPPPRAHQTVYHGVLSSRARLRPDVVSAAAHAPGPQPTCARVPQPRRQTWAALLRRVYGSDVLCCPRCGQRMALIATITETRAIRAILRCMGLPSEPPPRAAAQPAAQAVLWAE